MGRLVRLVELFPPMRLINKEIFIVSDQCCGLSFIAVFRIGFSLMFLSENAT